MAIATLSNINTETCACTDFFRQLYDELEMEAKELHLNFNVTEENNDTENIPEYLSSGSSSFQATFLPELRSRYRPVHFEDLQCLSGLTYKLSMANLHRKLWQAYLQYTPDQMYEREKLQQHHHAGSLHIRFHQVTSLIIAQHYHNINNINDITQDIYVDFIKKNQLDLDNQAKHYQIQFDTKKQRIEYEAETLTYKIDKFIQNTDYMTATKLHFEARIALLEYIYMDELLQDKYRQQKPNEEQIKLAQDICTIRFQKEQSEQELILFKFGVLYKKLPDSLNILEESPPTLITSLIDPIARERLSSHYTRLIQRTKVELMTILTTATEIKKDEYHKKFEETMASFWNDQHALPPNDRVTTMMLSLIDERQRNIVECVKRIYALRTNYFIVTETINVSHRSVN